MNAKATLYLLFLGLIITNLNAYEKIPMTISPGSEEGIAAIAQVCPTFSWAAVEWAEGYRVAVFEVVTAGMLPYEEMEALSSSALSKEINGFALSWTPSSDERLSVGREYVWYVQAVDAYSQGIWSEGRMFKVDVGLRFDGVEEIVRKKLQEQGLSEEVIEDVLGDMKSDFKNVIAYGVDTKNLSDSSQDKMRIQDLEGEGEYNTFFGLDAGVSTTGLYNSFFGRYAGYWNIAGYDNTFIGYKAGFSNSEGFHNTFLGNSAGLFNTTGDDNTFLGNKAGYSNTTGNANTFFGSAAGEKNTEGYSNLFMGYAAGHNNTTGFQNTFLGRNAGYNNTTGFDNTFLGFDAGRNNTDGIYNTFIGLSTGHSNTTGQQNTFLGFEAGFSNTTGGWNVYLGNRAGRENTTGDGNVFLGSNAGYYETGSNKLYIDNVPTYNPLIWGDFSSNVVAINGQLGVGTQSPGYPMELERTGTNASIIVDRTDGAMNYINATASFANFGSVRSHPLRLVVNSLWTMRLDSDGSLTMRNGATCTAGGEWQNASSRKLKENIRDLTAEEAAEALEGLAPVRFNYKADQEDESLGFIAEDVPDLVATKDRKGMSAMDVVAVLTKVVQEQQRTVLEQQKMNQNQQEIIYELRRRIDELEKN